MWRLSEQQRGKGGLLCCRTNCNLADALRVPVSRLFPHSKRSAPGNFSIFFVPTCPSVGKTGRLCPGKIIMVMSFLKRIWHLWVRAPPAAAAFWQLMLNCSKAAPWLHSCGKAAYFEQKWLYSFMVFVVRNEHVPLPSALVSLFGTCCFCVMFEW